MLLLRMEEFVRRYHGTEEQLRCDMDHLSDCHDHIDIYGRTDLGKEDDWAWKLTLAFLEYHVGNYFLVFVLNCGLEIVQNRLDKIVFVEMVHYQIDATAAALVEVDWNHPMAFVG